MLSSGSRFLPKKAKERNVMSNSNNNRINVPQAKEAMNQFKMQAAQEVGVNLTNGYNGHLTSREAGSVGGQMVKNRMQNFCQRMSDCHGLLLFCTVHIPACPINHASSPGSS